MYKLVPSNTPSHVTPLAKHSPFIASARALSFKLVNMLKRLVFPGVTGPTIGLAGLNFSRAEGLGGALVLLSIVLYSYAVFCLKFTVPCSEISSF